VQVTAVAEEGWSFAEWSGDLSGSTNPTSVVMDGPRSITATFTEDPLPPCSSEPFVDVPVSHPFCAEIQWMADNAISMGYSDGTYRPGTDVTRQAMSAFMYRLAGEPPGPFPDPGFSDVSPSHHFFEEISWMAHAGVTTGYSDGTYRPGTDVTRQAMSAFMYRLSPLLP
jgi:hypothetical protein